MTNQTIASFKRKLLDFNQWKIEQSNKLRGFHETQRKLLICDAQPAFKPSSSNGFEFQNAHIPAHYVSNKENCSPSLSVDMERSGPACVRGYSDIASFEKVNQGGINGLQDDQKQETKKEKKKSFLKKGDGLARFKMTMQDFKNPPKIYTNRQLRAQLSRRIEKNTRCNERGVPSEKRGQSAREKGNFSVDIYVADSKPLPINKSSTGQGRKKKEGFLDGRRGSEDKYSVNLHMAKVEKAPLQNSVTGRTPKTLNDYFIQGAKHSESETKRDEKELKVFEILEEKVNEASFCSSSSFIDKLLNQSPFSSPPDKGPFALKGKNCQDMSQNALEDVQCPSNSLEEVETVQAAGLQAQGKMTAEWSPSGQQNSKEERGEECSTVSGGAKALLRGESGSIPLSDVEWGCCRGGPVKGPSGRCSPRAQKDSKKSLEETEPKERITSRDMALKLQRKGLQDNVKRLMSWEPSPRKKLPKKTGRKLKTASKKTDNGRSSSTGETDKIILSSGLLRERLDELEKEIMVFRKENAKIEKLQKECHEERVKLARERKDFEKRMQEEREKFQTKMAEDRKKLQKDRNVFETYYKQTKDRPGREERQQTEQLKKELEKISQASATKEARWAASQARSRNQIRILQKENLRLTAECDNLRKSLPQKHPSPRENNFNAKIIRAINAELAKLSTKMPAPADQCRCSQSRSCAPANMNHLPLEEPLRRIRSAPDIKNVSSPIFSSDTSASILPWPPSRPAAAATTDFPSLPPADPPHFTHHTSSQEKQDDVSANLLPFNSRTERALDTALGKGNFLVENEADSAADSDRRQEKPPSLEVLDCDGHLEEGQRGRCITPSEVKVKGATTREKVLQDGTIEIVFPNGNVKKVSPDNKITRVVYYNGDIKEINCEEGSEKYYYCETRTWHITYRDGMEVIEFPNGQTERRYLDGSSEISFPNGCVRYCDAFGRDEWRFLDGTVMKSNRNGHKILLLANGQKEIQTKEYKQREYPDGTVKVIYSNGVEETRYASGRVRLKDPYGNLLMDSARI